MYKPQLKPDQNRKRNGIKMSQKVKSNIKLDNLCNCNILFLFLLSQFIYCCVMLIFVFSKYFLKIASTVLLLHNVIDNMLNKVSSLHFDDGSIYKYSYKLLFLTYKSQSKR